MTGSLEKLLSSSSQIIENHKQIEILRGETFNIFSILNLESREDATHSAFIGELLNPKGSHMMGTVFLKLFIKSIGYAGEFETESAKLTKEFFVGGVNNDTKTGGRIDLFLKDQNDYSISIENKIYAKDQRHQIERYVNYNKSKNTVYYLTLSGKEPEPYSKGELKSGEDFHCLSYASNLIEWLKACQKEVVSKSIIRESIRQYIIILKKLTNQLSDNEMKEEIINLISQDYNSARVIASNIEAAEYRAAKHLFQKIESKLNSVVDEKWEVEFEGGGSKEDNGLSLSRKDNDSFWIGFRRRYLYPSKRNLLWYIL